ncbi:MAG: AMP-binding protein, partial [Actinomycetes bacterium]
MTWDVITKPPPAGPAPVLHDYVAARSTYDWTTARRGLAGMSDGGVNMAFEAVDRHVRDGRGQVVALRFLAASGVDEELTYAELSAESNRFANVLASLGVAAGETVFGLMGRRPALYAGTIGTLKNRSVFCPMFSAFGPQPVRQRMQLGAASVLLTTPQLYRKKVAPIRGELASLRHVLLVGEGQERVDDPTAIDLDAAMAHASDVFDIAHTDPEDMALLHFTSGTTGAPKGVVHVHDAVAAHLQTARLVLDLHDDDTFWCTADPGWVTGMSYGIIAPLACGVTSVVDELEFDADRWYTILQEQAVTVWYTAPTALRMLMRGGIERALVHDLSTLRHVASVGEPLNPEIVAWGLEALHRPVHDTWWQTETG